MASAARCSYERCLEMRPDYRPASEAMRSLRGVSPWRFVRGLLRRWSGR